MNMADKCMSYSSVFVVDSGTISPPPLPPKPGLTRMKTRRNHLVQKTLIVLVLLSFCGLAVEGYFIYNLYINGDQPKTAAEQGDHINPIPVTRKPKPPTILVPPKPLAHLAARNNPENEGIMKWNDDGQSLLYKLEYRDGKLIIQEGGYYYVYSKLTYGAEGHFSQTVEKNTTRYLGGSIKLLEYRRHDLNSANKGSMRNSYLGGVFHLYKGDAVFVHVKKGSSVNLSNAANNFFGMFML
ncbi:tumor necrosis factor ligand superfamily member 14-like isoform 1-T2 [Clarias gariepinus]|uniref:tumor necrosis factor ligand superfamily member 6-like n=1 Tax=Clarias gariepinus TaxID=13013 RepID=UPI00234C4302|nr:tumor necrosis factor ligand superfamily member 6-like [Clarias gariepinus]XP_053349420.1 tumor necrosis factor ligand superfamily member 6-like [Clarias gariepinus]